MVHKVWPAIMKFIMELDLGCLEFASYYRYALMNLFLDQVLSCPEFVSFTDYAL